jgi:hypothetical protein
MGQTMLLVIDPVDTGFRGNIASFRRFLEWHLGELPELLKFYESL